MSRIILEKLCIILLTNKVIVINIFFVTDIHFLESVQENKLGTGDVKDSCVFRIMILLEIVDAEQSSEGFRGLSHVRLRPEVKLALR